MRMMKFSNFHPKVDANIRFRSSALGPLSRHKTPLVDLSRSFSETAGRPLILSQSGSGLHGVFILGKPSYIFYFRLCQRLEQKLMI